MNQSKVMTLGDFSPSHCSRTMVYESMGNENDTAQFFVCPLRPIFQETSSEMDG